MEGQAYCHLQHQQYIGWAAADADMQTSLQVPEERQQGADASCSYHKITGPRADTNRDSKRSGSAPNCRVCTEQGSGLPGLKFAKAGQVHRAASSHNVCDLAQRLIHNLSALLSTFVHSEEGTQVGGQRHTCGGPQLLLCQAEAGC